MARHIRSSKKAREALAAQRKFDLRIALSVAAGLLFLLFGILYFVIIYSVRMEQPELTAYVSSGDETAQPQQQTARRDASRPSASQGSELSVITTLDLSQDVFVPTTVDTSILPASSHSSVDFGSGFQDGFEDGIAKGAGLPGMLATRCDPENRKKRLLESGGTLECEEAVVKSLRWLNTQQNSDGSWGKAPHQSAMTGLCLLTYLAHCETPYSGEFGVNVLNGMTWLVNLGMQSPVLSTLPGDKYICYEHSIATYALCETYTFCKLMNLPALENLQEVAKKAVLKILDSQHTTGGWCYYYGKDSPDTSITGWNVQALKAALHANIGVDRSRIAAALNKAADFVKGNCMPDGLFSYWAHGQEPRGSLVGVGVLSLQMAGQHRDPATLRGLKWIHDNVTQLDWDNKNDNSNLYMHYYCVQAALNRGGDIWTKYNKAFRDTVLQAQQEDGSFRPTGTAFPSHYNMYAISDTKDQHYHNGSLYRQTMATLMLEVYYRFLPGTGKVQ